jgi:hypothetical protein
MVQLINEAKRFQKLAGILKENLNEAEDISQEIQALVDKNDFLKGKVKATPTDIIEGSKFVLLFSEDAAKHIAERHLDGAKPGSLFKSGVNLRDVAKKLLNVAPSEESGGRVKWLGANGGNVGEMGVAKASPEEVAKMKDYTMPDGQKEQVKIASGKRKPTSEVSLITAELGTLENGKKALSMITMFPGGTSIDGTEIPMNRGEFASKGFYFVVDPSSSLLKENKSKRKKLFEVLDDLKESEEYTAEDKDMELIFDNFPSVTINVDIKNGVVTRVNGDIEKEGIYSYDENNFATALKPFKDAGVKVDYTPWRSSGGNDYEGYFNIDTSSLNNAIASKKIIIKSDPEDPEDYLILAESINIEETINKALNKYRRRLNELQYFHNGANMNQIINYDDSDITDDLEALGQGSMDGQDFKPGQTYNIGGQEYKINPQGDEFKLVLAENIEKIVNEALRRYRRMLNEDNSDTLNDYFYGRDLKQYTGVTSFETCDEDDWDKVKDYIEKDKSDFLQQHPEITEQEFDNYMENWIDNIEEARGYESRNQQDMNMDW